MGFNFEVKSDQILEAEKLLKIGNHIKWTTYRGLSVVEVKAVEDYVTAFFKTGNLMPIHFADMGLDILGVDVEYDNVTKIYSVTINGIVQKLKGVQT